MVQSGLVKHQADANGKLFILPFALHLFNS